MKYSKGTWNIRMPKNGQPKEECERITIGADGIHVATIHTGTDHKGNPSKKAVANASLIAAAPEMLDALKDAEFLMRKVAMNPKEFPAMLDSLARCSGDLREIIEKAEGNT